jgi:EAL domain-containing protein (putative c-di-GMP-specific phosphodiesterase class I)
VAEGVEDRATLDLLIGVGCDLAQGYFIGRLVPAGDLATELTAVAPSLAVAELAAS